MAFAGILEDILAGVEAGDYMYKTMEYYSNVFPFIYINMIRVGELSGSLEVKKLLLKHLTIHCSKLKSHSMLIQMIDWIVGSVFLLRFRRTHPI